jgi:glycosyltransferase involved in cell wall biosynthesis
MRRFAPDIVHETYYSHTRTAPSSSKVVLTVFDMIHERFPAYFSSWDPLQREKVAAVQRADHVICISEHTRRDLVQLLGVEEAKTSVVHLGFSLTGAGEQLAEVPPRPYLLYVGARGGYKNFEGLLKAYSRSHALCRDFDLVAFGGGVLTPQERALIVELGLDTSKVRQMGGPDSVLAGLYRSAALFVYPSLYEGFGIPPLEAMSFNCPVACSNTSSIPEVVGDAASFFDPESTDSMVAAIESVLNHDKVRKELIAKGQQRILQFSWEKCAVQTQNVYRSILT